MLKITKPELIKELQKLKRENRRLKIKVHNEYIENIQLHKNLEVAAGAFNEAHMRLNCIKVRLKEWIKNDDIISDPTWLREKCNEEIGKIDETLSKIRGEKC